MTPPLQLLQPKPKGFTLIELLTVIAIIGILAAILIPAVSAAKNTANRAKTKSQLTQLATAMTSFKQEYGYYPVVATGNKIDTTKFCPALCAKADLIGTAIATPTSANTYGNIKLIPFYIISSNDLDNTVAPPRFVDAFGNTDIAVRVDTNGDGKIDNTDSRADGSYTNSWTTVTSANTGQTLDVTRADPNGAGSTSGTVQAGVILYSAGKGTADSDIVTTWQ